MNDCTSRTIRNYVALTISTLRATLCSVILRLETPVGRVLVEIYKFVSLPNQ